MTRRTFDPGTPVARYRVVSLLGAGAMGEVYPARNESLGRAEDPAARSRFKSGRGEMVQFQSP